MWDLHAIQIQTVNYLRLSIEVNATPVGSISSKDTFSLQHATSEYCSESKAIAVKVMMLIGYDENGDRLESSEYWMDVVVEGIFSVDESKFPLDKIGTWAEQNAPLILYPFVREAAFSLSNRVLKDSAAILPLLTVPTIKI